MVYILENYLLDKPMLVENIERIIGMLDYSLNTKRKRHIAGGILASVSLLFGSMAFTILTLKEENRNEQEFIN